MYVARLDADRHMIVLILLVESVFTPFSRSRGVGVPTLRCDDLFSRSRPPAGTARCFEKHLANCSVGDRIPKGAKMFSLEKIDMEINKIIL